MLCRTKDSPAGYVLLASPQYIDQAGPQPLILRLHLSAQAGQVVRGDSMRSARKGSVVIVPASADCGGSPCHRNPWQHAVGRQPIITGVDDTTPSVSHPLMPCPCHVATQDRSRPNSCECHSEALYYFDESHCAMHLPKPLTCFIGCRSCLLTWPWRMGPWCKSRPRLAPTSGRLLR